MSGAWQWKREPAVWIIAVQSAVLVFLAVFYFSWKGSASELIWQLKHGSDGSRRDVLYELTRMGRGATFAAPVLKEALEDSDPRIQTMAADALLHMGAWARIEFQRLGAESQSRVHNERFHGNCKYLPSANGGFADH